MNGNCKAVNCKKNTNHVDLAKGRDNGSSIHLFACISEAKQFAENMTITSLLPVWIICLFVCNQGSYAYTVIWKTQLISF